MPAGLAIETTRILLACSIALLAAAAVHDVATRTVPNWMPVLLFVAGLAVRLMAHQLGGALFNAFMVFLVTAFLWRRRMMGGADVKLLTVAMLLVAPSLNDALNLLLAVALAGGVLAFAYLAMRTMLRWLACRPSRRVSLPARRGRSAGLLARIVRIVSRRIRRLESLPYASAIAVGTIFVIIHTV